jgi:hypothetical protein
MVHVMRAAGSADDVTSSEDDGEMCGFQSQRCTGEVAELRAAEPAPNADWRFRRWKLAGCLAEGASLRSKVYF